MRDLPTRGFGRLLGLVGLVLLSGCSRRTETEAVQVTEKATTPGIGVQFADVTEAVGLDFRHVSGSPEQRYILESMAPGGAFFDFDGDGYQDVFMVNSSRIREEVPEATNRLYRNVEEGGRRVFDEVTEEAGLRRGGWGMGCATGDYDNDGDVDLYVTYWGSNVLYRNNGDAAFTDVTELAGVGDERWGSSAAFGDLDGDGYLDLYVTNYLVFDMENPPGNGLPCSDWKGLDVYCGPHGMTPQGNALYRNNGDGTFADMSAATGIDQHEQASLGVVFGDYDNDGDQDMYVANDGYPNLLYRNEGDWSLPEVAAFTGAAYSEDGRAQAGMGVAAGDYDNDGDLDLYVSHFSDDVNTVYQNQGDGTFVDYTAGTGMAGLVRPFLCWSTGFFDADNDGWLDVFVVSGHIYPQVDVHPSGIRYAQRNLLYHNEKGRFREVSEEVGPGFAEIKVSRGGALGDYDNDGDLDLLVMNLNEKPILMHNYGGNRNSWLGLKLVGTESNRDALGARVRVRSGEKTLLREVQRAYGYQSSHDARVLFGLGREERVDQVEIRWPSGRVQILEQPELRRYLVVEEGKAGALAQYGGAQVAEDDFALAALECVQPAPSTADTIPLYAASPKWSADDHYREGVRLYNLGRYNEALEAFRASIHLEPDTIKVYYSLGVTLYSGLGRTEEAAAVLEEAVARDSSWSELCQLLGVVYMGLDRADLALGMLERARELDPASWEVDNRLGLAHLRRGDLGAAAAAFQSASRKAPWMPHPHLNLARTREQQGNTAEAMRERQVFEELRPTQETVARFREHLSSYPEDPEARCSLGETYAVQGRFDDAMACFRQVIEMDSTSARAYYGMGAVRYYQGQPKRAIAAYERALALEPGLTGALADLGETYHQIRRYDRAVAAYERALALQPDLAGTRIRLGLALASLGRLEEAARVLEAAARADSTLVEARDALARVLTAQGRYEEAIGLWEEVLRLAPQHPQAADRINLAREKLVQGNG